MFKAKDIATYFLSLSEPDAGDVLTHLKLQKLCYYAQGFSIAINDTPLFDDPIEAWDHGPVVPSLYHEFKKYGSGALPVLQAEFGVNYDDNTKELLNEIYNIYGQFSAWKLRNMTHEESPWIDAFKSDDPLISHDALKDYFKEQLV